VVHQVGDYAIAETRDEGVYGIGPTAETTWFVPGDGIVDQNYSGTRDVAPTTLATQSPPGSGPDGKVVISLADGKVIKPQVDESARQQQTSVYPGGFAAVIGGKETQRDVQFFDVSGRHVKGDGIKGLLVTDEVDLPVVSMTSGGWAAYSSDGDTLLDESGDAPQRTRLIGKTLFVNSSSSGTGEGWQRYDLSSGAKGQDCNRNLGAGYVATDGRAAILRSGNPNVGLSTSAIALDTCDVLWTMKSAVGSFRNVWRINTTLVQLSDDATELMSLVAPR
jgi:hypothetical protein